MTIPGIEMQNFEFNEHGACINPETVFEFRSKTIDIKVMVAKDESWSYGYDIRGFMGNSWGTSSLPGNTKHD